MTRLLAVSCFALLTALFQPGPEHPEWDGVGVLSWHDRVALDVRFHQGVTFDEARTLLREAGAECDQEVFLASRRLIVEAPREGAATLMGFEDVAQVDRALLYFRPADIISVKRMRVEKVLNKNKYHRPNGNGVLVGVTDAWTVDENHVELRDRVTLLHDTSSLPEPDTLANRNHGTCIAGTVAAAGVRERHSRGVAPEAEILSMVVPFDPVGEILYAAESFGMRISANSWGYDADKEFQDPVRLFGSESQLASEGKSNLGYYTNFNYAVDEMVPEADVLYVWAAGNDSASNVIHKLPDDMGQIRRPDAWHKAYPEYDKVQVAGSSKNILAIGATHKDDVIASFSSRGPVHDGRLVPHVVAPGFNYMCTDPGNGYAFGSGTSGSCPMAAGVAALLLHQYREIHGSDPGSALLKAILINSARDLGLPGPDYVYGYGIVDAELGALTIAGQEDVGETNKVRSRFEESTLLDGEEQEHSFQVPRGMRELRLTLVWHDPPGAKLVNDLDISVRSPEGEESLPWVNNPDNPLEPATRGQNTRDNTEQLFVERPRSGIWTVKVKGRRVRQGPQDYALVLAAGKGNRAPITKTEGDFSIDSVSASQGVESIDTPETVFHVGDPIAITTFLEIHENASYPGGYYGTVSVRYELRDEDDELKFVLLSSMENLAPTAPGELGSISWSIEEIPEGLPTGEFRIATTVTMHNGVSRTADEEVVVRIE